VELQGLTSGFFLNRTIAQVLPTGLSTTQFNVMLPQGWSNVSTTADSGTATTVNVMVAFDSNARYDLAIDNISLTSSGTGQAYNVGLYFGSRVDTGTRFTNTWIGGATEYSYFFAVGGINVEFDKGWRSDGAGVAGIYWRVSGADSFGIANGTVDNGRSGYGSPSSGAAVMLDNAACASGAGIHFTSRNVKIEINTSLTPGLGAFTMYDCPSSMGLFLMDLENTWVAPASSGTAGFNFPSFVMSPANDGVLGLSILNGAFPSGVGANTTTRWVGIPELLRKDIYGPAGWIPLLSYAPSTNSDSRYWVMKSPISLIGDVNVSQLWQDGIQASDFLYSDTSFAALPNGTTLFAGQILAPPAYWNGANGKRYALDVVYQTGTTGTPNGGATTCTGSGGTSILHCSSATDLSVGQRITIGTDTNKTINYVDATNPSAVLVNLLSNIGSTYSTATTLSFSAPVLASEIQMPTKTSAAPTTLTWSQGDMEENSGAAANGVAAWVNVAAGTPGTWAGVPLGNSSGQIAPSQISGTTGSGNVVLASGPTFTGNTTTFANGAAAEQDVVIQPGTGGEQIGALGWNSFSGTSEWKLKKDTNNYLHLTDVVNSLDRVVVYQNGNTNLNAGGGANAVVLNGTANSGTGGLLVESGGSSPAAVLTVTGSGNTTATGFVAGKFMIGSGTMTLATGAAAGTSPSIACASSHVCDGVSGTVTLTTGTSPTTGTLATLSFPNTHANYANCIVDVLQSGVGRVTTASWSESTTAVTLTANAALTASTAYTVKYWCGGN
jgi:hypothetical protein